ncbi:hypothetical protein J437_LFUL011733 [Ladona fulva]|uniref:Major facilitator superfamily (MFS) profile domain-containing protein n=1 Tax=Ladona fulva TaxID=123851 RepID=A0A8K0KD78_LADFU|nr:hypothetical protein J437_LFUL011733 [Ladona fulva]
MVSFFSYSHYFSSVIHRNTSHDKLYFLFVLTVTAMMITACCGVGSYFVRSALQNLILSCALQAFNAASFSTLMSVLIELFPASLRGLAMTILMNMSYVGSIAGNLVFGLLLDISCAIPVFLSAGVIAGCSLLCFFLPNTKNVQMSG